jgi:hypothetical protein
MVDPKSQSVSFRAIHAESEFKVTLQRGASQNVPAIAHVTPVNGHGEEEDIADRICSRMSSVLTSFFNEMTFELDGTFLSFTDMMVVEKRSPTVMLAVAIRVVRLPGPGRKE